MRKCINGEYFDMTDDEIAQEIRNPNDLVNIPPSINERLEALEQAMLDVICGV